MPLGTGRANPSRHARSLAVRPAAPGEPVPGSARRSGMLKTAVIVAAIPALAGMQEPDVS